MPRDPIKELRLAEAKVSLYRLLLDVYIGDYSDTEIRVLYWLARDPVIQDRLEQGKERT